MGIIWELEFWIELRFLGTSVSRIWYSTPLQHAALSFPLCVGNGFSPYLLHTDLNTQFLFKNSDTKNYHFIPIRLKFSLSEMVIFVNNFFSEMFFFQKKLLSLDQCVHTPVPVTSEAKCESPLLSKQQYERNGRRERRYYTPAR